ncbi:MAG: thymidine kinase, partial [Proteobacteria bacterium]|nr:thymidine kinase [Pseudomonadota bacterium]
MFSGKTEELIRRITRAKYAKQRVLSFKPKIDSRYSADEIASHSGARENCHPVEDATNILDIIIREKAGLPHLIAIEELQFFDQEEFYNLLSFLRIQNVKVIIA